jgi:ATP-dependent helicase HepA
MSILNIGQFVAVDNKYGIGKLTGIDGEKYKVHFFIDIKKQITEVYESNDLKLVYLSPQTRVYVKDESGQWKIGRIKDFDDAISPDMDYLVKFPNQKEKWFPSEELEVRCLLPFIDPTEVLSTSGGETQFLYDARKRLLDWLINLRASSRGLTSVTSASIDLVVHQINIARKILTDPVQRYLLSDEVGMGKTIEAGLIARQCLLDSALSRVLIIVPEHLVNKWTREMFDRFYLDDFGERVEITTLDDNIKFLKDIPELIIIDEAHHIIGERNTYAQDLQDKIIKLSQESNKLLLLSATPGIGNEHILLNLLKVLDPLIFKNETLELFKEKVVRQSEHGAFLRTLKINQSSFLLKRSLAKVTSLFPDDTHAENLTNKLLVVLEDESQEQNKQGLIKQLKSHLVDTWRLHNRLIRTRRVDSEGWEFQDRGVKVDNKYDQNNIEIIIHSNHNLEKINAGIEDWRSHISLKFNNFPEVDQMAIVNRYITLLEASNYDVMTFRDILSDCLKASLFKDESELIKKIMDDISEYNYEQSINDISEKIKQFLNDIDLSSIGVLFITDMSLAKKYQSALGKILGHDNVCLFSEINDNESNLNTNKTIRVLICDISAEEGVDFQFADAIIHLDLPLNPSRVEQRIGRLDRYGRMKTLKIQHLIILPTDTTLYPWKAWFELLFDGFGVFNEPISDIQLKLEQITNKLHRTLLQFGCVSLENKFDENGNIHGSLISSMRSLIEEEREALDEQYALNHLSLFESDSLNLRDEIEDSESDEKILEDDINHWLFDVLKFHKWKVTDKIFEIQWSKSTLVPKKQFWSKGNSISTEMWEGEFANSLERSLTFYRKDAVENSNVSLLRPGHPLFFTLQHYLEWEDRGTAFSTFRIVNEKFPIFIPKGDIRIIFKLNYIVQAGFPSVDLEQKYNEEHFLYMRRTDDYFPPKIYTIYIDENLNIIEEEDIIAVLDEVYDDKGNDTNLGSRRHIIDHFIDPEKLDSLCMKVGLNSKNLLINSFDFKAVHKDALERATLEIEQKCINISRRQIIQEKINNNIDSADFERSISFEKSLLEGIINPNIKLDAFGMFFLSRYPLSEMDIVNE